MEDAKWYYYLDVVFDCVYFCKFFNFHVLRLDLSFELLNKYLLADQTAALLDSLQIVALEVKF